MPVPGVVLHKTETWGEKFARKFKENPWVPLGATATVATLIIASVKMRRGESQKMNHWLRARVVAQGFTILALCGGAYMMNRQEREAAAAAKVNDRGAHEKLGKERREFEERLRAVEEAHRVENHGAQNGGEALVVAAPASGWLRWLGWSTSSHPKTSTGPSEPKERPS